VESTGASHPTVWSAKLYERRLAADQGDANGQAKLGFLYGNGLGVPQDYILAHKWFNLSAAQGDQSAARNRDIVAQQMTPAQIAEAQKLAREWKATKLPR
jgi:TPR repeat protein